MAQYVQKELKALISEDMQFIELREEFVRALRAGGEARGFLSRQQSVEQFGARKDKG